MFACVRIIFNCSKLSLSSLYVSIELTSLSLKCSDIISFSFIIFMCRIISKKWVYKHIIGVLRIDTYIFDHAVHLVKLVFRIPNERPKDHAQNNSINVPTTFLPPLQRIPLILYLISFNSICYLFILHLFQTQCKFNLLIQHL